MKTTQQKILESVFGPDARFKPGQNEAIEALVNRKRALVIQKTGWGKSIVYFIATKIFRQQGYGLSIVISPLLALMNDQIESANKFGLVAETVNSNNPDEWHEIYSRININANN